VVLRWGWLLVLAGRRNGAGRRQWVVLARVGAGQRRSWAIHGPLAGFMAGPQAAWDPHQRKEEECQQAHRDPSFNLEVVAFTATSILLDIIADDHFPRFWVPSGRTDGHPCVGRK